MPDQSEELGYFYDTIHGRFALEDLPAEFRPALKAVLSSGLGATQGYQPIGSYVGEFLFRNAHAVLARDWNHAGDGQALPKGC